MLAAAVRGSCAEEIRYEYSIRSELTRVLCGGETLFGYGYDLAGNLRWSCVGSSTNVYETNARNQYTRLTDSNGRVYHFAYDEDGNLMEDARYMYSWDSACRMTEAIPSGFGGGLSVRNFYDAFNRRVKKEVRLIAPPGHYPREQLLTTTTFVYDGMVPVLETITDISGRTFRTEYCWGKDLSGTLDGACGVGGLLLVRVDGDVYVPVYDVGGNIDAYCNAAGIVVAERRYSPFGQMISAHCVNDFLFRRLHIWFSTKYLDLETGLYYFGGRFYSPTLCRWLNRDPLGERGGLNLYAFCRNDPISNYDKNGCAYFIKRRLDNMPWIDSVSQNANLDQKNRELVHEQLIFEDNGETTGAGYFGDSQVHEDSNWKNVRWVRVPGWYNDCVMRKAVDQVNPKPYSLIGNVFTRKEQYNCQDYADDLRAKYRELMRDKKVRCECKVDEKGRKK